MKWITITYLIMILCQEGRSQTIEEMTDFRFKVLGDIEAILETSYKADSNLNVITKKWQNSWQSDKKLHYDQNGNIKRIDYLNNEGELIRYDSYDYRENKLIQSKLKYSYRRYIYDDNGLLITEYVRDYQPFNITTGLEDPRPISFDYKLSYKYNKNNLLSKSYEYNSDGNLECEQTYIYVDETSKLQKMISDCGDVEEQYIYKYNENGEIIQISWSDDVEGLIEQSDYEYESGRIMKETWKLYDEGDYEGKVITLFEDFNELETREYDGKGNLEFIEKVDYEFDQEGNWIRKIVSIKGEHYIIKRQIAYRK